MRRPGRWRQRVADRCVASRKRAAPEAQAVGRGHAWHQPWLVRPLATAGPPATRQSVEAGAPASPAHSGCPCGPSPPPHQGCPPTSLGWRRQNAEKRCAGEPAFAAPSVRRQYPKRTRPLTLVKRPHRLRRAGQRPSTHRPAKNDKPGSLAQGEAPDALHSRRLHDSRARWPCRPCQQTRTLNLRCVAGFLSAACWSDGPEPPPPFETTSRQAQKQSPRCPPPGEKLACEPQRPG